MAHTAASIGIEVPPTDMRAGWPMHTTTSSPMPAPTGSTATRWPTSCDGAYQRCGAITTSFLPSSAGCFFVAHTSPTTRPRIMGSLWLLRKCSCRIAAVDDGDDDVLERHRLADGEIAYARAMRGEHAV